MTKIVLFQAIQFSLFCFVLSFLCFRGGLFSVISTFCRLFNVKSIFLQINSSVSKNSVFISTQFKCQRVLIQTNQFSINIVFVHKQLNVKTVQFQNIQFSVCTVSMSKTVLFETFQFQVIQFNISYQLSSTGPIDRALSGATTPAQSGSGRLLRFLR